MISIKEIKSFLKPHKKENPFLQSPLTAQALFNEFDVFYVCFDEPNRFENWQQVRSVLPKAQKVEGVVGFDQALKTCAKKSKTSHFFLIDGDNQLIPSRFKNEFVVQDWQQNWVLSWSSMNPINGLAYGNGGLKLWPKDVALNIKTHENADPDQDQTDYCFIADYFLVDDYMTSTWVNKTRQQAFRAGLREGVKMSLVWGKQEVFAENNFEARIGKQNGQRLKSWCEVGADVENGLWAILGARVGLKLNVIENFNYNKINSYDWIDGLLKSLISSETGHEDVSNLKEEDVLFSVKKIINQLGEEISEKLNFSLNLLSAEQSRVFKEQFSNPKRSGLLSLKKPTPPLVEFSQ